MPIRDTPVPVADLPFALDPPLAERLTRHLDREAKIARVLDELGPLGNRDVVLVGGGSLRAAQLADRKARVSEAAAGDGLGGIAPDSMDAVVSLWTAFRGPDAGEVGEAERVLRPGGRILAVHDYGRDDVSRLRPANLPEYGAWSRRDGPFLTGGWRIRVVHAWWTFDSIDDAREFLAAAFGPAGDELGAGLRRPRLSYNVAVYHRTKEPAAA